MSRLYLSIERAILAAVLLAIVFFLLLQVATRLLGTAAFNWTEEAARFLIVWLVFVGAGVGVRSNAHIMADILRPKSEGWPALAWLALMEGVVLASAVALLIFGAKLVDISANTAMVTLGFSTAWRSLAVVAGAALIALFSAWRILQLVRRISSGPSPEIH